MKTTDLSQVADKLLSYNVVHLALNKKNISLKLSMNSKTKFTSCPNSTASRKVK
jgi:hypothetical protein